MEDKNKIVWNRKEMLDLIMDNFTGEFNSFDEMCLALTEFEKKLLKDFIKKIKALCPDLKGLHKDFDNLLKEKLEK